MTRALIDLVRGIGRSQVTAVPTGNVRSMDDLVGADEPPNYEQAGVVDFFVKLLAGTRGDVIFAGHPNLPGIIDAG